MASAAPRASGRLARRQRLLLEVEQNRELLRAWGADDELAEIDAEIGFIERSNLRRLAELADAGVARTPAGAMTAATGLIGAIRRGAMIVTTNPVMVNTVRKDDPATWDPVRDALKEAHPEATRRATGVTDDDARGARELS